MRAILKLFFVEWLKCLLFLIQYIMGTSLGKECYTVINKHVDTPPKRAEKQA